ncbi:MAG TPA: UbiA-like protein EboC [Bryobacteraceae bacterium]|nr:UbiA-like protein EboC [Bryobacteraceae bacterium]
MQSTGTSANAASAGVSLRAHFEMMRPANTVTALGDVLAGFAVAGLAGLEKLPWLLAAGMALYAGGVTMNDFFDRRLDAAERPERPIPSGRAGARSAAFLGMALLLAGVACGFRAAPVSGAIAGALASLALAYDAVFKHIPLAGPLAMGSCRGLDLLLGVSANGGALAARWYVAAIPLAYIAGVTLLSAGEVHGGSRLRAGFSAGLLLAASLGALVMGASSGMRIASVCVLLALLAWRVGPAFYRACANPDGSRIRAAVRAGVISLVFLDASIAAAWQGLWYALGMVALVVVASHLARLFPVE